MMRRLLLALVGFTAVGLVPELLLLKHYDSVWQLVPFAVLAATLVTACLAWRRPTSGAIAAFRVVMWICVAAGIAGVALHAKGNWEWALERDDTLRGWPLMWKVLRGATPLLAPGAMAQLGLLGLLFTYRHPALERGPLHLEPEIS
ncbi:MAG: hypothetical protein HOQ17_04455 [Gemmatimonadaceae bacterium]|nr:hypothetical protein [Gemmatimonadaceae bacterium]NUS47177.1 hypothetical protein [Gemmatimonadaceae bacterium]